jgi:hypothetical protein
MSNQSTGEPRNGSKSSMLTVDARTVLIGLVVLSGGGNFLLTKNASDQNLQEAEGTTRQIHEIHQTIERFRERIIEIDKRWEHLDQTANEVLGIARRLDAQRQPTRIRSRRSDASPQMPTHVPPYPTEENKNGED